MENIKEYLKLVMRHYPQGVTVVTCSINNKLFGLTVSAFTSISLEPPLVMISISKQSKFHEVLIESNYFAVNILAEDQKTVSDRFAGRHGLSDKFEGIDYFFEKTRAPIIRGVVAFIECEKWSAYDGGDHTIVLGKVINAKKLNDKKPLVYHNQQYTTILPPEQAYAAEEIMWW